MQNSTNRDRKSTINGGNINLAMLGDKNLTFNVGTMVSETENRRVQFGAWLKQTREGLTLTQQAVADAIGKHVNQIGRIETGESGTKRETIIDIVGFLNKRGANVDVNDALQRGGFAPLDAETRIESRSKDQLIAIGFNLFGGFGALTTEQQIEFMAEVREIGEVLLKRELNKGAAGEAREQAVNGSFIG